MLEAIRIRNFKAFGDLTVRFTPLTLLLGSNGAGKSTILQSLLVLRQSSDSGQLAQGNLDLSGHLCVLGTGQDILHQGSQSEEIEFDLTEKKAGEVSRLELLFEYRAQEDRLRLHGELPGSPFLLEDGLIYLTAERVGPRLANPRSVSRASRRDVGITGEGSLSALQHFADFVLGPDDPRNPLSRPCSITEAVQHYLGRISPGFRLALTPYGSLDSISASFDFQRADGLPADPVRATNVGFGLSYSLSIVIAGLISEPGAALLVENPEAHLHPKAQREIALFLRRVALAGVQVLAETHSREIFYALRQAESVEGASSVSSAIYFYREREGKIARPQRYELSPISASLQNWPTEFYEAYGSPGDLIAPVG
jgi:predicted ATPase